MSRRLVFIMTTLVAVAVYAMAADHRFTLVIDPGHGGHDAGALGAFSKEKNINLKVALAFGRYVERNCPDVRVVYTRKTDVFVPLNERANIANRAKADLFISVHTNALPQGRVARGFEVYTLGMHRASENLDVARRENSVILVEKDYKQRYEGFDPNSAESYIMFEFMQDKNMAKSVELAKMVQQEVCAQANRPNKGVHQAGFLVLRATSMPSCLVELGFITTGDEERLLNSESGIDAHARGLYRAFNRYKKKYNEGIVVPFQAPQREQVSAPAIVPETRRRDEQESTAQVPPAEPRQAPVVSSLASMPPQGSVPIFKVQIIASSRPLKATDSQFKGERNVDSYQEGSMTKYTIGASADYNEIYRLRKSLLGKFPEAFIIAFKNGEKMDVRVAIQEFKDNKHK